jgi:hypothetical protein
MMPSTKYDWSSMGEDYATTMRRESRQAAIKAAKLARLALAADNLPLPQPPEPPEPQVNHFWRAKNFVGANPANELKERLDRNNLRAICLAVYRETNITVRDLRGPGRLTKVVNARNQCFLRSYIAGYTFSQIGRYYGKDHTSVRHGIARAAGMPAFKHCKPKKGVIADVISAIVRAK